MKKIFVFIKKYHAEIGSGASLYAVIFFFWLWGRVEPVNRVLYWLAAFLSIASLFLLAFFIRKLWFKYRSSIARFTKSTYVKLGKKLIEILDKIGVRRGRGNLISGSTTVTFSFFEQGRLQKRSKRRAKWKLLETDRQRLGYLYQRLINRKLEGGSNISHSDTPDEIARAHAESDVESRLFTCYSDHRYYDPRPLDGEELVKIKEELGIK